MNEGFYSEVLETGRRLRSFQGNVNILRHSKIKMAGFCLPPLPALSSSTSCCVFSSEHGVSQHTTAEGFPRFRSLFQGNRRFLPVRTKGRRNLKVVAVEENHLEAKLSNLTFDMAQTMTDVATVTSDVGVLQKEVTSLRTDLTRLAGSVEMLRASNDRLDNLVSRCLESYEKHEKRRNSFFFLIIIVLVLDLVLESFALMDIFKTR